MSHAPAKCRRCQRTRSGGRMRRLTDIVPHSFQAAIHLATLPFPMERFAQGYEGFEDLRKFIKHGSEFSKDVGAILHERAELESTYAKGLNKLAAKLLKAVTVSTGSLADGWKAVGVAMEQEAELHKNLAAGLADDICKPLKTLVENQVKARKPIEAAVEKSYKSLQERRGEEFKLEKKSEQLYSLVKKVDKEYTENAYKAETARQEWDVTVAKASSQLQQLEEERMNSMQDYLNKFNSHISVLPPKMQQIHDRMNESVIAVDLRQDIHSVVQQKGSQTARHTEQILIDCYAEDTQFTMNMDRRKDALRNFLIYLHQLIEKERKGKDGVQKLVEVYKAKPTFADPEAQEDTRQKLQQTIMMLNFLEASHFKINSCLCKLEGRTLPQHAFEQHIECTRDKQNYVVSVLKLPVNMTLDCSDYSTYSLPNDYMELASPVDDEFDDFDDDFPIAKCTALYDYKAEQNDELSFKMGDVITVYGKTDGGWWQGEINGRKGAFPSTYVKEM
ncbi:hypothetical protein C0Q70_09525 [Pomacea canaliculata]|uniref:SH3 domain-containing protein n=3 Tax=Pomacea canaliculata TaxID=400727 RepID=A0A2T7PA20_POMCA|nr:hypothetical protein C0Q70_09525 [Pomacea canaliculata]